MDEDKSAATGVDGRRWINDCHITYNNISIGCLPFDYKVTTRTGPSVKHTHSPESRGIIVLATNPSMVINKISNQVYDSVYLEWVDGW